MEVRNRKSRVRLLIVMLCFCMLLVVVAGCGKSDKKTDSSNGVNKVLVPDFVGMTIEEISKEYSDFNIVIRFRNSNDVPAGIVISQDKNQGRMIEQTQEIEIIVSSGAELVEIPKLNNLSKSYAEFQLHYLGLKYNIVTKPDDIVAKGHVISTDPKEGSFVEHGTQVDVYISLGPEVKYVKNIDCVGYDIKTAKSKLEQAGLKVGTIEYEDSDKQAGVVLRQDPDISSFQTVPSGLKINLVVSTGKTMIQLPDFCGKEYADIVNNSDYADKFKFKLVFKQYSDEYSAGKIISQSPKAGEFIYKGATVEVVVSLGSSTVTMPNITGLCIEDALMQLMRVGLSSDNIVIEEAYDKTMTSGVIIRTDPKPGVKIDKDANITIVRNSYIDIE